MRGSEAAAFASREAAKRGGNAERSWVNALHGSRKRKRGGGDAGRGRRGSSQCNI